MDGTTLSICGIYGIRIGFKQQSRIQKLHWIQKLGIQKLHVGFRNYSSDSETISSDSETLADDSETISEDSETTSEDSETLGDSETTPWFRAMQFRDV